jgi:hypothetical protein
MIQTKKQAIKPKKTYIKRPPSLSKNFQVYVKTVQINLGIRANQMRAMNTAFKPLRECSQKSGESLLSNFQRREHSIAMCII